MREKERQTDRHTWTETETGRLTDRDRDSWLVVSSLWHINLCELCNAKSIFMHIVLFLKQV